MPTLTREELALIDSELDNRIEELENWHDEDDYIETLRILSAKIKTIIV